MARFETCKCQACGGGIEFDASGLANGETLTVNCPHCTGETMLFSSRQIIVRAAGEQPRRDCNRVVAALLAIFLGCLGIHRFYMGQPRAGTIYVLISVLGGCFGLFVIMALVGLVEGIVFLTITQEQFEDKWVNNPKSFAATQLRVSKKFVWIGILAFVFITLLGAIFARIVG